MRAALGAAGNDAGDSEARERVEARGCVGEGSLCPAAAGKYLLGGCARGCTTTCGTSAALMPIVRLSRFCNTQIASTQCGCAPKLHWLSDDAGQASSTREAVCRGSTLPKNVAAKRSVSAWVLPAGWSSVRRRRPAYEARYARSSGVSWSVVRWGAPHLRLRLPMPEAPSTRRPTYTSRRGAGS